MAALENQDYVPLHKACLGKPFLSILNYNKPYWRNYLIGSLLAVLFVGVGLAMPMVLRAVVGRFQTGSMTYGILWASFGGLLAISVVTGIARYWERMLIIGASRKAEYDLRNDFFRHIQTLSQDFFHRTQTGDIMARATNDLNYVRMFIGPGIMGTIDLMRLPFTLAMMTWLSPKLTLVSLLPMPVVSLLVYASVMFMHKQSQRVQEQFSVLTARSQENLAGARVVQAYGIGDLEVEQFRTDSQKYLRQNMVLSAGTSLAWPLIGLAVATTLLIVLYKGGSMTIQGTLALEDLTGFIVCMLMLIWPLAEFGWILTLYQRGSVGMKRINEIFAEIPSIRDTAETQPDMTIQAGSVQFEQVSSAYGDFNVLRDISFEAPAGKTIAIVGPTGSGKTSIVNLLTREQDPVSGRILIDGFDSRMIPIQVLRGAIGYVPQDTFLFSDTIRENLTFGCADASEASMDYACSVAQFTETLNELPNGYNTLRGERGVNLSGGQKQRLAIARAILCNPKILVLDDALSSVDTHTEERILRQLKEVMASRTSVTISHRISTIQHADLILVLQEGRIVERGTHAELVARKGLYTTMYERQLLEDELEQE